MNAAMNNIKINANSLEVLSQYQLPSDLAFGKVIAPVLIESFYENGKWSEPELVPYHSIELDPTCKVLHYAQEIFEGLKAYKVRGEGPYLFRPDENFNRFNLSAKRMAMPEVPHNIFIDGVKVLTSYCSDFIPQRSGDSLYIRPFMFATENNLGIKPSEKFTFMIVASPSAAYFSTGSVSVLVEKDAVRACPGGVGNAKTGGNYAASLHSMIEAKNLGYHQVLWLDAVEKKYIEEMSGMNFFAVYGNKIITPNVSATILDGITRKSLIELGKKLGYEVEEKNILIDELLKDIKEGKCTECFACGTAVIITPVDSLGLRSGEKVSLKFAQGPVSNHLRESLLAIQEGRSEDHFNWRIQVPAHSFKQ